MRAAAASPAAPPEAQTPATIPPPPARDGELWRGAGFFGALFLCLWLGVDGRLIYHGGPEVQPIPVFYWGADFAAQFLGRPGGIGEYLMALGMQTFYYPWYGALVFVGSSILVWAAVRKYVRSLGAPLLAGYILPLSALALYSMYVPACRTMQNTLAATLALWAYSSLPASAGTALRAGVFAALAGALFAISPGGLLVLVAACVALELAQARWTAAVLALGIGAGVTALEGCVLYGYGGAEVWNLLLPSRMDWARARQSLPGAIAWLGLAGFVPLLGWITLLLKPLLLKIPRDRFRALLARRGLVFPRFWLRPLLAAGVVFCVYACARDGHLKSRIAADYFAGQGLWQEAFAAAKNEIPSPIAACLALRAAYHTGRLTRQMLDIRNPDDVMLDSLKGMGMWTRSGPVFYSQTRVGQFNKPFNIYKLRSMTVNAETKGAQWAGKNDPRVTRIGKIIRKTRLDEVPQFWNILKGEMSLIGPRPERPEFVSMLAKEIPFYSYRHLIKPGLSGWAQINYPYGASKEDSLNKLKYDLYYIKNASFLLDSDIILRTLGAVMKGAR